MSSRGQPSCVRRAEIGGVCDVAARKSITDQEQMSSLTSWLGITSIDLSHTVRRVPRFPVCPLSQTYIPSLLGPLALRRQSHADFNALAGASGLHLHYCVVPRGKLEMIQ